MDEKQSAQLTVPPLATYLPRAARTIRLPCQTRQTSAIHVGVESVSLTFTALNSLNATSVEICFFSS